MYAIEGIGKIRATTYLAEGCRWKTRNLFLLTDNRRIRCHRKQTKNNRWKILLNESRSIYPLLPPIQSQSLFLCSGNKKKCENTRVTMRGREKFIPRGVVKEIWSRPCLHNGFSHAKDNGRQVFLLLWLLLVRIVVWFLIQERITNRLVSLL